MKRDRPRTLKSAGKVEYLFARYLVLPDRLELLDEDKVSLVMRW